MATKWKVGQEVFVVRGDDTVGFDAKVTVVGRKYGTASWGSCPSRSCEFVLSTGYETDKDGCKAANNWGCQVYSSQAEFEETLRQKRAIDDLARIFGISAYSVRYAELSPSCIDELLAVIEKHETERA